MGLQSESRWCLSGTPPVGDFADIKGTAALLGINLGSDEVPRYNKSEITKVETFQFFKDKPTQQWHKRRWEVAQGFLNRYMRQNIAEIDEIKFKEDVCDVQLRPAERAIYLELDHYLQSMDMKAKKKKRGASESDRDARLAAVLGNSSSAEEALLKRVAHFELDDEAGTALRTCQDIVNVRKTQQEDCFKEFGEAILKARARLSQMSQMPDFTPEDNPSSDGRTAFKAKVSVTPQRANFSRAFSRSKPKPRLLRPRTSCKRARPSDRPSRCFLLKSKNGLKVKFAVIVVSGSKKLPSTTTPRLVRMKI